jgi:predicted tellurium resistance membrane protein TerC
MESLKSFTTLDGWVSILVLVFLELVLGVENLVFIAITSDRLPDGQKSLGRRIGLIAAFVMRCVLLVMGFMLTRLTQTLFMLPLRLPLIDPAINAKDLILLAGGGYLVYKGIHELKEKLTMSKEMAEYEHPDAMDKPTLITLPQAVGTIMVMDMVFSIDSVITALGLSGEILLMIFAVLVAITVIIIFADTISEFINDNPSVKIMALVFIIAVGLKLVILAFGVEFFVEGSEVDVADLMLYFAMGFALVIAVVLMVYNRRLITLLQEATEHRVIKEMAIDERLEPGAQMSAAQEGDQLYGDENVSGYDDAVWRG